MVIAYGPCPVSWYLRTIGLRISPYQKLSKLRSENVAPHFCKFLSWNRFVRYLSTFFYTYLPINIHFQLIIITNVSILTDPAYFVPPSCHCGILALRSRDFWEITVTATHVFGLWTWKTWKCWMFTSIGIAIEENNIFGWYL